MSSQLNCSSSVVGVECERYQLVRMRDSLAGRAFEGARGCLLQTSWRHSAFARGTDDDDRERAISLDEADQVHFRRCTIARPITQSLSLSLKLSSSVNWLMR